MNEHPGHFWVCFWLFLIWLFMPTYSQVSKLNQSLDTIATAISQNQTAR